ncbi:MAG: aminotransferase class I/II-fold pyridoxal phosphate-dependent enzyme [Roseburia sp.]|nr:aminotransferase class I/II-fold pyridoxal phosphate-dependent enzyme [Roseburia sp.]
MKQRHGGDIYHHPKAMDFSTNVNPYGPPKGVMDEIKKSVWKINTYPDPDCRDLRKALEEKLGVPGNQIILGNGSADLMFALCQAVKPEKALIPLPSFLEYQRALLAVDCKVMTYKTRKEEGFSLRKDFVDAIGEDMDIVFLCNPNNPTGNVIEHNLLIDILKKCQETDTYLVVDECFNEFISGARKHTLLPLVEKNEKLLIIKAFTKLYGIPGIRLGYIITGDEALPGKIKKVTQPWGISVLAQAAGLAALKGDAFVAESLSNIEKEKRRMIIAMSKAGYLIYESAANFIFFEGEEDLAEICLNRGILIRDCSSFAGLSEGYFRVCVRTRWENEKLLKVLAEAKQKTKES